MTIRHIIYNLATALLAGVAVSSCSSSDSEPQTPPVADGEPVAVSFSLSSAPMGGAETRANFQEADLVKNDPKDNEIINSWIVGFAKNDIIVAVVEDNLGENKVVEDPMGEILLPKGSDITAIAFANIDKSLLRDRLKIGTKLPADWKNHVLSSAITNVESDDELIPMSGYQTFTVNGAGQTVDIEVVRMLCKVEFTFLNKTQGDVKINSVTLKPVYKGDIYLFSQDGRKPAANAAAPRIPSDDQSDYGLRTLNFTDFTLGKDAVVAPANRKWFYIKESNAYGHHETNRFHIKVSMTRAGAAKEDLNYALAGDALQYFNRNDYVLFPLVLTDYVPEFEVLDYPPIGGYPVNVTADGDEFYAKFHSSGYFDISARLRDSQDRTVALSNDKTQTHYVVWEGSIVDGELVSPEDSPIKLEYDQALGVWHGEFNTSKPEHARVVLKFKFYIKVGEDLELTYERTLHLISSPKNS